MSSKVRFFLLLVLPFSSLVSWFFCLLPSAFVLSHSSPYWSSSPSCLCSFLFLLSLLFWIEIFGYPNIGGFVSAEVDIPTNRSVSVDALVTLLSTIGSPSLFLAYFSAYSTFQLHPDWFVRLFFVFLASDSVHCFICFSFSSFSFCFLLLLLFCSGLRWLFRGVRELKSVHLPSD